MIITLEQKIKIMSIMEELSNRNFHVEINMQPKFIKYYIFYKCEHIDKKRCFSDLVMKDGIFMEDVELFIENLMYDYVRLPFDGKYCY